MWGHLVGGHLQQSSGCQVPNTLQAFFPCWMALLCCAVPFLIVRTTFHVVWDELEALFPGLGLDIQLNCPLQDEVEVPGHENLQVGRCTECDGLCHSHGSRELGQAQGAASRTYKNWDMGHGTWSSTSSRTGCERKQLLFPGSHCSQPGSAFPLFNPETGGFTHGMIHEDNIINHQAKLLCWAL